MPTLPSASNAEEAQVLFNLGCSSGGCIVEPWLAEGHSNFRIIGISYEKWRAKLSFLSRWRFGSALNRFPNAVSCLEQGAKTDHGYDLLKFDWRAQSNPEMLMVCLSRIHNAIADPAYSARWFEEFGFSSELTIKPDGHYRAGWSLIDVIWRSTERFPAPKVSSIPHRLLFGGEFTMGIQIDHTGTVHDVSVSFSIK